MHWPGLIEMLDILKSNLMEREQESIFHMRDSCDLNRNESQ